MRVGVGYDIHQFEDEGPLVLCGVQVATERGLAGHSDADVGLHALCDALLGAAGLGDIGDHFPPGDPDWLDADSRLMVAAVIEMLEERFAVGNVDITLVAEWPKMAEHRPAMRREIAKLLNVDAERVSVKATTNERLGALGRSEGIAAVAVALINEKDG